MTDIDKICRYADSYEVAIEKQAGWPALVGGAWFASMVASQIRNLFSGIESIETGITELLEYIGKERPKEGWGENEPLMNNFITAAQHVKDNAAYIKNVPSQPSSEYIDRLGEFLNQSKVYLSNASAVEKALEEMQALYAKPGQWLGELGFTFGLDVTDLMSIQRLNKHVMEALNVLVGRLEPIYDKSKGALKQMQTQQVAVAPGAAGPQEALLVQLGDITV